MSDPSQPDHLAPAESSRLQLGVSESKNPGQTNSVILGLHGVKSLPPSTDTQNRAINSVAFSRSSSETISTGLCM